jgi:hypothetical protein
MRPTDRTPLAAAPADPYAPTVMLAPTPATAADGARGNVLAPGTRLADFEIVATIGEGGFGIVYEADDLLLQRRVAIKEYVPAAIAMRAADGLRVAVDATRHAKAFAAGLEGFLNEARLLARFDHPSLVKVFRFWEANGTAYMVMPRYRGITLAEALRRRGPPDEAWLRAFLAQLLDALAVIHAERCWHRDVAPDNILLLQSDRPLLLDFGAARRAVGDVTQAMTAIVKPGFAPIEQYADLPGMKQGPWSDVYAVAAVVHHAITGRLPPAAVARLVGDQMTPLGEPGRRALVEELPRRDRPRAGGAARRAHALGRGAAGRPAHRAGGPRGRAAADACAHAFRADRFRRGARHARGRARRRRPAACGRRPGARGRPARRRASAGRTREPRARHGPCRRSWRRRCSCPRPCRCTTAARAPGARGAAGRQHRAGRRLRPRGGRPAANARCGTAAQDAGRDLAGAARTGAARADVRRRGRRAASAGHRHRVER